MTAYAGAPPGIEDPDAWIGLFGDRSLSRAVMTPVDGLNTPLPLFKPRTHALVGKGESCKSLILGHNALTVAARGGHVVTSTGRWAPADGGNASRRWAGAVEAKRWTGSPTCPCATPRRGTCSPRLRPRWPWSAWTA